MTNQINPNLPKNKELAKQVLDNEMESNKIKLERGWLGSVWGNSEKIPNNLAALTICVLLLTGVFYTWLVCSLPTENISLPIKDFWAIISPLITLAIGYLFGNKTNKSGV